MASSRSLMNSAETTGASPDTAPTGVVMTRIVEELESIHPGVEILVTDPLDGHPALLEIVMARAGAAVGSL